MSRVSLRAGARLLALVVAGASAALAADYYASPTGSPTGNGSYSRPLDLETALSNSSPARPGDTLYLRGGMYRNGANPYLYRSRLTGAVNQYITVRPVAGENAEIDGGIEIVGPWVIFRDLRLFSSSALRYTSETGSWPSSIKLQDGFSVHAPHVKLINNFIRDARAGISSWSEASDNEIYGNVIFYSGWQAPDRAHGPGIYAQNEGAAKVIAENVIANQFRNGLQFYGSDAAPLDNLTLTGNVFFNNGYLDQSGSANNFLVGGGRVARNIIARENHSYFPLAAGEGGNNLGYWPNGAGCQGVVLEDNRLISGDRALAINKCSITSMRRNLIVGPIFGFSASSQPNNTYRTTTPTTGAEVFVRPNKYETGRAHVVVYNWASSGTVKVDVSASGLRSGDSYELINLQNPEFDIQRGVYSGQPLTVSMTNRTVAAPNGWNAPASTFPQFGVFLLVKTPSASTPPNPTPDQMPPAVSLTSPAADAQISGTIRLTASASDESGVSRVEFLVDGQPVGAALTAPYELSFNTSALAPGNHVLKARATDMAGNSATSAGVTVSRPSTSVQPPPVVGAALEVEAEEGVRSGLRVALDGSAGGSRYVIGQRVGGTLTFDFATQSAANVAFWARGRSADPTAGRWTVMLDGVQIGVANVASPDWAWSAAGGASPLVFPLSAGTHRLTLKAEGFKAHLDSIRLAAAAANATSPTTPTAPAPAPPPAPSTPTAASWSLLLNAMDGTRSGLRVGSESGTIGGWYAIGQRVGGTLTFRVDAPSAMDVALWARGRSAIPENGFWTVRIDGMPVGEVYLGAPSWGWSALGRETPTLLRLSAGTHQVEFRAEGFKGHLDVIVLTNALSFRPTDGAPTPAAP